MTREKIRFCTSSDGVRIAYAATGKGPPLVKVANWLAHLEFDQHSPIWRHWAQEFSRDYTYVHYDCRGCGLSDRAPAEISFESWVRDLEAVVDAAGLERFALLGLSQGGPIAAAYAVRHPERVTHLVACGAYVSGALSHLSGDDVEKRLLYHNVVKHAWGMDGDPALRRVYASRTIPDATAADLASYEELERIAIAGEVAVRCMQAKDRMDVSALLPRIACPTLVMHICHDSNVSFEEGRRFAALVPGARFIPLDGRNHHLLVQDPAWGQFLEEVRAFVPAERTAFAGLTARERALLEHLARGLDNHQIAAHLELSEKTVRNMVSSVLAKLEVESRAQAIVRAREAGYGASSRVGSE